MSYFRKLSICGILVAALLIGAGQAAAHQDKPVKSVEIHAGPYQMVVNYYSEPRGGQALLFEIVPQGVQDESISYHVVAVPGTMVNAVPVRAMLQRAAGHPGAVEGQVSLPVSGQWLLNIDVTGAHGSGAADAPILAGTPPAIPEWLGWLMGLTPIAAMLGVIIWRALSGPAPRRQALSAG